MMDLWQDVRFGSRMLEKHPGFTAVAVLSLAVGIGLNSAIFSLVNQTILLDPPVREPDRVFTITGRTSWGERSMFAYPDREDFHEQCPSLEDVVAVSREWVVSHHRETPRRVQVSVVSRNYFSFFGARPILGRLFLETDEQASQDEPVAVISHSLWQRDFGRDPNIIGRTIQLEGLRVAVLGVASKGFVGTNRRVPVDLWVPADVFHSRRPKLLTLRDLGAFSLLARLRPGAAEEAAQSEVKVVSQRLAQDHPSDMRSRDSQLTPIIKRKDTEFYLGVVGNMLLPGAILVLSCANVCALLTARAQTRVREIAARLALGGSRARLIRQMLVESLLLSLVGGAVGLLLANWMFSLLPSFMPPGNAAEAVDLYIDGKMLVFTAALSVFTTFLFGLLPAWQATKPALAPLLRSDSGFGLVGRRFTGLRRIVTGQFIIPMVTLCVAGVFLRGLQQSMGGHPGFQRSDLLLIEVNPGEYGLEPQQIPLYMDRVREQLEALPGVHAVSVAEGLPLDYYATPLMNVRLTPGDDPDKAREVMIHCSSVDEILLDLMGVRLLSGRGFTRSDDASTAPVTVVSQATAQEFWPDRNPVGQVILLGDRACEVIGVATDGSYNLDKGEPQPYFFFSVYQADHRHTSPFTWLLESQGSPRALILPVRETLRAIDERVLPIGIQTLHDRARATPVMVYQRFTARFFGLFGVLALLLASIGLYAVVAYAVSRRTQEIGIRMAVGATRPAVTRLVLREGLRVGLIGVLVGLPIALGITHLCRVALHGLPAADPVTFTVVPLLLVGVALLACWLPARRAARVDPMAALRCE
jgi:predicted permease